MWVAHGYFAYVNEISFAYPEHLVHEGVTNIWPILGVIICLIVQSCFAFCREEYLLLHKLSVQVKLLTQIIMHILNFLSYGHRITIYLWLILHFKLLCFTVHKDILLSNMHSSSIFIHY